jgi:hypothetical protein
VDGFGSVFNHFFGCIFDVSAGTTTTARVSGDFQGCVFVVNIKSPFPVVHSPETFPSGAIPVPVANNNTYFHGSSILFTVARKQAGAGYVYQIVKLLRIAAFHNLKHSSLIKFRK